MLTSFLKSRDGNIAMMFGFLFIPLVAAVGLGIDFGQASFARTQIAEAADAAALAAARARLNDKKLSAAKLKDIGKKAFDANAQYLGGAAIGNFDLKPNGDSVSVMVNAVYETNFMRVVGYKQVPIDVAAEVQSAPPRALEAVLVLDNTGSMSGTKIKALKDASQKLITSVMEPGANVKIGVVPFANYVNVGVSRRNAPWLDVPADETRTVNKCSTKRSKKKTNCRSVRTTCKRTNDGVTTRFPCTKQRCDVEYGDPKTNCGPKTTKKVWKGCVGSRNAPHDVEDAGFSIHKAPGLLNISCSVELLPLTDVKSTVEGKIKSMKAQGNTYIPAGLSWGLRLISNSAPFTEGATFAQTKADQGVKSIILMTDGENTKSATYPLHDGSNTNGANTKTAALCTEIKSKGVEVYTIAFEVTDTVTKNLLQACATSPTNYFDASNPAKLFQAFDDIAASLKELAITQ